jgi:hypothetical protein
LNILKKYAKLSYHLRLELCLIIALLLTVIIFYLFPIFTTINEVDQTYTPPVVEIIETPPTSQSTLRHPPPLRPLIPVEVDEIDLLSPVTIDAQTSNTRNSKFTDVDFQSGLPKGYRPRQLLEVVPQGVSEEIKGEIVLALRIGTNGKMISYRIVQNTTGTKICEEYSIKAAKASLWESASFDGQAVEYWIEKTYKFNTD